MAKVEWFLDFQQDAKAYRVTKVKVPKLGFTMYRESLQRENRIRHIHMCSEKLFPGDLEEIRVKEPFFGVDMVLIHNEMRFENVAHTIMNLKKTEARPIRMTIDMSLGASQYREDCFKEALEGLVEFSKTVKDLTITFATTQFHPMEMDVWSSIAKRNESIVSINMANGMYTPYLHRTTMRSKKGAMCLRNSLWEKQETSSKELRLSKAGYLLYLRFVKCFHEKGYDNAIGGACNPSTITRLYKECLTIDNVICGHDITRPRVYWQIEVFWTRIKENSGFKRKSSPSPDEQLQKNRKN